jgi:hypothetical protein
MTSCLLLAVTLLIGVWIASPQQLPVLLYKLSLVSLAGVVGYWLDRWAFPYARPDGYLALDWRKVRGGVEGWADHPVAFVEEYGRVFAAAMLRRAIIMTGAMLAVGLGL